MHISGNGCYYIQKVAIKSWNNATAKCENHRTTLVKIDNSPEEIAISEELSEYATHMHAYTPNMHAENHIKIS